MPRLLAGLRVRLVVLVALALLPAVAAILYGAAEDRRIEGTLAVGDMRRLSGRVAASLQGLFEDTRRLLVTLAEFPPVRDGDAAGCGALLARLHALHPRYSALAALTPEGDVFCSSPRLAGPHNAAVRPHVRRALETRTLAIGEFRAGTILGIPHLPFVYPVVDPTGRVRVLLYAGLSAKALAVLASQAQLPPGGMLFLADGEGRLLARYPEPERWVGRIVAGTPVVTRMLAGAADARLPGLDGTQRVFGFARVDVTGGADGIHVAVGVPAAAVDAPVTRDLARNLGALVAVAVLALGLSWAGSEALVLRPVRRLVATARRLAAGDLDARTGLPHDPGELGHLASAFDEMAATLERRVAETRRAQEATAALVDVSRELAATLDPAQVADRVVTTMRPLLRVVRASLLRLDPESGDLICVASAAAQEAGDDGWWIGRRLPAGAGIAGRAIAAGGVVSTPDILAEPDLALSDWLPDRFRAERIGAVIAVPLLARGKLLGVAALGDVAARVFTDDERRLLAAFADQAAVAMENAGLFAESERRRREAEVVAELARTINASLDLDTVLQRVTGGAVELCRSDLSEIRLWDPESKLMVSRYWAGVRSPDYRAIRVEPGKGAGGQVIVTGRPLRTDDYAADPRITKDYLAQAQDEGVVAQLVVPILMDGRVEGLLYVSNRSTRRFTDEDEAVLARLAEHAVVAIQNARLHGEAREQLSRSETFLAVARAVGSTLDLTETMRRVARELARAFGADMVGAYVPDPDGSVLRPLAGYHLPKDVLDALRRFAVPFRGHRFVEEACERQCPVFSSDPAADPRIDRDSLERFPHRSLLFVPILVQGKLVGGLGAVWWHEPHAFTPEELGVADGIGRQAALALENARLFVEAERRRKAAESLAEVGQVISQSLDPEEVAQRIVDSVLALLAPQHAVLYRLEPDSMDLVLIALAGDVGPALGPGFVMPRGNGVVGLAVRERRPIVTPDLLADARITFAPELRARIEQAPYRAVVAMPLLVHDHIVGVFSIGDRAAREFSGAEIALLRAFANQAAVALDNARLFAEQTRLVQETRRQHDEAQALELVGRQLTSSLERDEVLQRIVECARTLCGCDIAFLAPCDAAADTAAIVAVAGGRSGAFFSVTIRRDHGAGGIVLRTGEPFTTGDYLHDSRVSQDYADAARAEGTVAEALVPLRLREGITGLLGAINRTPRPFTSQDLAILGKLADQAAIALENSRLFAERRQAEVDLRVRARQQAALAELGQAALASADLESVIVQAGDLVVQTLDVELCEVLHLSPDGERLLLRAGVGWEPGWVGQAIVPSGTESHGGYTLLADSPVIVEDLGSERRFTGSPLLREHGVVSGVSVIIRGHPRPIGVLGAHARHHRRFTDDDVGFLQGVANVLGTTIERVRAEAALRQHAERLVEVQEAERRHLARELHDEIGQVLTGLKLMLETRPRADAAEARRLVDDLITRVRELSLELRPAMLDDLGLLPALLWHLERYAAQTRVKVRLEHSGLGRRFPPDIETAAYRIVQEALTNVARHAGVATATLRLWIDEVGLGIQVEDRGRGFDSDAVQAPGARSGLAGMRERTLLLKGALTVESAPGAGTRLTVHLPLPGDAA